MAASASSDSEAGALGHPWQCWRPRAPASFDLWHPWWPWGPHRRWRPQDLELDTATGLLRLAHRRIHGLQARLELIMRLSLPRPVSGLSVDGERGGELSLGGAQTRRRTRGGRARGVTVDGERGGELSLGGAQTRRRTRGGRACGGIIDGERGGELSLGGAQTRRRTRGGRARGGACARGGPWRWRSRPAIGAGEQQAGEAQQRCVRVRSPLCVRDEAGWLARDRSRRGWLAGGRGVDRSIEDGAGCRGYGAGWRLITARDGAGWRLRRSWLGSTETRSFEIRILN